MEVKKSRSTRQKQKTEENGSLILPTSALGFWAGLGGESARRLGHIRAINLNTSKAALDSINNLSQNIGTSNPGYAYSSLAKESASLGNLSGAMKKVNKTGKFNSVKRGVIGAGIGATVGAGLDLLLDKKLKSKSRKTTDKKKKQKTFSNEYDRPSSWIRKRIEEEMAKSKPNQRRLKNLQDNLNYVLYYEGKETGATAEQQAAGKAAEEAMKNSGRSNSRYWSSGSGSNYSAEERIRQAAERNATRNNYQAKVYDRYANKLNRADKKLTKAAIYTTIGAGLAVGGIKAYQHYKHKKSNNSNA